jgi:hypothetical protein
MSWKDVVDTLGSIYYLVKGTLKWDNSLFPKEWGHLTYAKVKMSQHSITVQNGIQSTLTHAVKDEQLACVISGVTGWVSV